MSLLLQIFSFVASSIFGGLFGVIYNLSYSFLYFAKLKYKILINILFIVDVSLLYFIVLLKVNNGVIHFSFILLLALFFILTVNKTKRLRKILKAKICKINENQLKK